MKNRLLIILIISLTIIPILSNKKIDSGWDTSYDSWDSGSSWDSWDSGSSWDSWDSGSSWDSWDSSNSWSSYDSDYHYSSSNDKGDNLIPLIIVFLIIIIIVYCEFSGKKNKTYYNQNANINRDKDVINKILAEIPDFDQSEFLKNAYDIYINVQNAWMTFNYEELQKNLTDSLYNSYKMQLKPLKEKHEQNVMSEFKLINQNIISFSKTENEYVIKTDLSVTFYDYVIDSNKKVIRGTDKYKIFVIYELTYIRSISKHSNKCPNCNAELPDNNSNICPYCKSTIVSNNYDWVMSKKEVLKQSR